MESRYAKADTTLPLDPGLDGLGGPDGTTTLLDDKTQIPRPNTWPDPPGTGAYLLNLDDFNTGKEACKKAIQALPTTGDRSNLGCFNDADTSKRFANVPNLPRVDPTLFDGGRPMSFLVNTGENGETYHALFAAVSSPPAL